MKIKNWQIGLIGLIFTIIGMYLAFHYAWEYLFVNELFLSALCMISGSILAFFGLAFCFVYLETIKSLTCR